VAEDTRNETDQGASEGKISGEVTDQSLFEVRGKEKIGGQKEASIYGPVIGESD